MLMEYGRGLPVDASTRDVDTGESLLTRGHNCFLQEYEKRGDEDFHLPPISLRFYLGRQEGEKVILLVEMQTV
jgi:hypothetical protein